MNLLNLTSILLYLLILGDICRRVISAPGDRFSPFVDASNSPAKKPAAKKPPSNKKHKRNSSGKYQHRRRSNHHGSDPNRAPINVEEAPSPARGAAPCASADEDPALKLDGDLHDIWGVLHSDGFYYWSWEKFIRWERHNWDKLDFVQKAAMKTIRIILTDPEEYESPYTERHHMMPKSCGGNPAFSPKWCVSLTYSRHLIVHACYAIVLPHQSNLVRSVAMCMLGFGKQTIVLSEILRTAGATDGIASKIEEFKKKNNDLLKGNTYSLGYRHTQEDIDRRRAALDARSEERKAEHRRKIGEANRGIKKPNLQGHQHSSIWEPWMDEILAELAVVYAKGKDGQLVDWKRATQDARFKSLPDRNKAIGGRKYHAAARISIIKEQPYEHSKYKKGDWELMKEAARKRLQKISNQKQSAFFKTK